MMFYLVKGLKLKFYLVKGYAGKVFMVIGSDVVDGKAEARLPLDSHSVAQPNRRLCLIDETVC